MATKCITIMENAYERLMEWKGARDSFTDVILERVPPKPRRSLLELAGVLSDKEADELRDYVRQRRAESRRRIEKTSREIAEALSHDR